MLVKKGNNMLAMITPTLRKDSLVLLFVVGVTIASVSADSDVIAETNCGHIRGKLNSTTNIASFKGIPYAAPPLGKLRWSSPISREQAGMCWGPKTVLDTLDFGPFCAQFQQGGQEDCLYLNVWSPWNQSSSKPLPVMVYIYGGDLTDGNTNLYPMDYIAEQGDVVAVSMNYRLNLFGFLATRELSQTSSRGSSGNYGFEDQQLALHWVQTNIQNFGGDPSRVTVFGQSSGGTSTLALLSSPGAKGLLHGAIALSPSTNLTMDLQTAEKQNEAIVSNLGCSGGDSRHVVQCMRSKTLDEVRKVIPANWNTISHIWGLPPSQSANNPKGLNLPGIAIVDGVVVTKPLLEGLSEGMIDVPLVIGTLAQEPDALPNKILWDTPVSDYNSLINESFQPWGKDIGPTILDMYEKELETGGPEKAYCTLIADYGATCASMDVARTAAVGFSSPVYSYVITQCPVNPMWNFDPFYQNRFAFHSFDVLAGFGRYGAAASSIGLPPYHPQPCDLQYGELMRQGWFQLAHTGRLDPDVPGGWKPINDTKGFPSSYNVGLIGTKIEGCSRSPTTKNENQACFAHTQTLENYKKEVCKWWKAQGFGQSFWWSN